MTAGTVAGRQVLAEDVDDAEFFGRLLAANGNPDFETVNSLGVFTRGGSRFRATRMDTDEDVLFFRIETGTAPDRHGTYPRNAETGELVQFRGSIFVQQLSHEGHPSGPFAVMPTLEFHERFPAAAR